MTQAPQQEVEVQGRVGEAVALPVGNDSATAYRWTLELPDGVEAVGSTPPEPPGAEASSGTGSRLLVRSDHRTWCCPAVRSGATLAESPTSTPMTILLIRLTVS